MTPSRFQVPPRPPRASQIVTGEPPVTGTVSSRAPAWSRTPTARPSGDQKSALTYQGSGVIPDACGGGQVRLDKGGTFSGTFQLF